MIRNIVSFLILGFLCSACIPTTTLMVQDSPNLRSKLYDGKTTHISRTSLTEVAVLSGSIGVPNDDHFEIVAIATNKRAKEFLLSTDSISIQVDGEQAEVETYEQRKKQKETEAAWAAVAVALGGAAQAYSASMPQYTYGTYNSYGGGFGTYSGTTYNSAASASAVASVNANTMAQSAAISTKLEADLEDLKNSYLKPTQLERGMTYGGKLRVKAPRLDKGQVQKIALQIRLGSDVHSFILKRSFDEQ